jgi:hypothetical protein
MFIDSGGITVSSGDSIATTDNNNNQQDNDKRDFLPLAVCKGDIETCIFSQACK